MILVVLAVLVSAFLLSNIFFDANQGRYQYFKRLVFVLIFFSFSYISYLFLRTGENTEEKRIALAATSRGPIEVAVVWPKHSPEFVEGVQLAVDEINEAGLVMATDGLTSKQNIVLRRFYELGESGDPARAVASNLRIVAALGHADPDSALSASITYQENGVLFMAPTITDSRLTSHDFDLVLRNIPSDRAFAQQLALLVKAQGWKSIAVLAARTLNAKQFIEMFRKSITHLDIPTGGMPTIVLEKSYAASSREFHGLASQLAAYEFDAILVADYGYRGAKLIRDLRTGGVSQPVFGSIGLHSPQLWEVAGNAADGTFVATLPARITEEAKPMNKAFRHKFKARHKRDPGFLAAQGYEAMSILAQAWQSCGVTVPRMISFSLKSQKHWHGLFGDFTFASNGDIHGKSVCIRQLQGGVSVGIDLPGGN